MGQLVDRYQRKIDYLRISITDRCNLRCRYCMPPEGVDFIEHDQILSYEKIVRIVQTGAKLGIKKVRVTGGEPLVRKGAVDLIRMLKNISGIEEVALTTNGVLLAKYASQLVTAGLDRVNISLDTLQQDKFREITNFDQLEQVIEGIKSALEVGLTPVKINVVVMQSINDDEIFDFIALTRQLPVHVRFIEYMPAGSKESEQEKYYIGSKQLKKEIKREEKLLATQFQKGNGPAYYYQVSDSLGTIGFISPISNSFCSSCNRLRLTSTGDLRACLCNEQEINLRDKLKQGEAEVKRAFQLAVDSKAEKHSLSQGNFNKNMSQIGG
ncbi:molybdenum cofactor biosynthesis protein A [Halobacteroides halobius DSM 5150]|uniref:GTP 3',8-cyclase n=1 Tax=Halobacteroides halobius (strain ATCC 35273 / DSM 5150 / MD-1) TaxID=748449 RepID=L0K842_HALHC|nr:GTP 3',8-cyclase MoaA [Halobacteroides halobius]AGB41191.1 molybdenum cofactor biosynthesis protein A [Halobacteroides halobius DSM 5150]